MQVRKHKAARSPICTVSRPFYIWCGCGEEELLGRASQQRDHPGEFSSWSMGFQTVENRGTWEPGKHHAGCE